VTATNGEARGSSDRGPLGLLTPLLHRILSERDGEVFQRDPGYVAREMGLARRYASYFSPEVRGLEHLPAEGPVLVVGNHSGVFYMPEVWITGLAIEDRRGIDPPAYALTYDLLLAVPRIGRALRRIGSIPAGNREAEEALRSGALVVVYPGGDWEACRPWLDRNTVDFCGHTGFARLALRTGVPVVPVVAHGSHDSVIVVSRGEAIAKALGLGGLRIKVFPLMLGPLGLATALNPPPPMPSSVTVEFLPAVRWPGVGPDAAEVDEVVERCAGEVVGVMQEALDRLRVERAHPLRRGVTHLVTHPLGPAINYRRH
jgi:1-acyl-sn-glycerol-3-phosphate acyltransferase